MMEHPVLQPVKELRALWVSLLAGPAQRLKAGVAVFAIVVAMLVARAGTTPARAAAVAVVFSVVCVVYLLRMVELYIFKDVRRTLVHIVRPVDAQQCDRALRALSLLAPSNASTTSEELVHLHLSRVLSGMARDGRSRVVARAGRRARLLNIGVMAIAATIAAVALRDAWAVVEGGDVLVARHGVAPLRMEWVSDVRMTSRPPEYLHAGERQLNPYESDSLPEGSHVTVRARPVRSGRRLALSDGTLEVPFEDDGSGHIVARWALSRNVDLFVVARFGDVRIRESYSTRLAAIVDQAPTVKLHGAPKRVELASEPPAGVEIPIRYEASDDHGLKEVQLVLRSGGREERRVLSRLDGETRFDRGGYVLRATDRFFKATHVPVEVRVEAKDNDPLHASKWGVSEALTVVPPEVGQAEAMRLAALRALRDGLVDDLADRLAHPWPASNPPGVAAPQRRAFVEREVERDRDVAKRMQNALSSSYAGLQVSRRIAAMLREQMRKLSVAVYNFERSASTGMFEAVVKATEKTVLVFDAAARGLAVHDARALAKELVDVADDVAAQALSAHSAQDSSRARERMDASMALLRAAGRSLPQFGALGRDLGVAVRGDLARIDRARAQSDFYHAALAARDLAERLRQPDPSSGGGAGRPSLSSGSSQSARSPGSDDASKGSNGSDTHEGDDDHENKGESDDVAQAFQAAAQQLDDLARDHAEQMQRVAGALAAGGASASNGQPSESSKAEHGADSGRSGDQAKERDEASKRAQSVREAVRPLPQSPRRPGADSPWDESGADARDHAEQMARALEQGALSEAAQHGREAMSALREAKRRSSRSRSSRQSPAPADADSLLDAAAQSVERELQWAEEHAGRARRQASERARADLRDVAEAEKSVADRARALGAKPSAGDVFPPSALEALAGAERATREASDSLRRGDIDRAVQQQQEAQRRFESAREAIGEDASGKQDGAADGALSDGANQSHGHAGVPKTGTNAERDAFRRRVMQGLAQPNANGLQEAVKRYAEGLLR